MIPFHPQLESCAQYWWPDVPAGDQIELSKFHVFLKGSPRPAWLSTGMERWTFRLALLTTSGPPRNFAWQIDHEVHQ